MSKLSLEDVKKLAALARIDVSDEEVVHFADEISEILQYVELLQNADTEGTVPTYQVTGLQNVTREDVIRDYGTTTPSLLQNAPRSEGDYFKVARMVG